MGLQAGESPVRIPVRPIRRMPAARTFRFPDRQRFDVAPGNAIDAFYHPFAYAAKHENSYRLVGAETTVVDG
jgi:hypothetical protein